MEVWELIHISGDPDGGLAEKYQGLGASMVANEGSSGGPPAPLDVQVSISPFGTLEISDPLWGAQSARITKQSEYLESLQEQFREAATGDTSIIGIIKDASFWVGEWLFTEALAEWIEKNIPGLDALGEVGDSIARGLADAIVASAEWLVDFFIQRADPGYQRCATMLAENAELLALEKSQDAYKLRADVLRQHQQDIKELEAQLTDADSTLIQFLQLAVELLKMFLGDRTETERGWDDVLEKMTTAVENVDEWIEAVEVADTANLPVPSAPSLPSLPSGDKEVTRKVLYLLAQYGFKLATEMIKKSRETDTHITDLVSAVHDLQYNNEEIELPSGLKVSKTGKLIQGGN